MSASKSSRSSTPHWLGYLTYVELPGLGTVGGLLTVDRRARPLEFHCTAPLLPNRTQEILYGKTLRSTMLCDQIGRSLVEQLPKLPALVISDEPLVLGLREFVDLPITLCSRDPLAESDGEFGQRDGYHFVTLSHQPGEMANVMRLLDERSGDWDWLEPIERISEAIREAHRAAA